MTAATASSKAPRRRTAGGHSLPMLSLAQSGEMPVFGTVFGLLFCCDCGAAIIEAVTTRFVCMLVAIFNADHLVHEVVSIWHYHQVLITHCLLLRVIVLRHRTAMYSPPSCQMKPPEASRHERESDIDSEDDTSTRKQVIRPHSKRVVSKRNKLVEKGLDVPHVVESAAKRKRQAPKKTSQTAPQTLAVSVYTQHSPVWVLSVKPWGSSGEHESNFAFVTLRRLFLSRKYP
jgi:hypothetical protein